MKHGNTLPVLILTALLLAPLGALRAADAPETASAVYCPTDHRGQIVVS